MELVKPYVSRRADDPNGLKQATRTGIERLLGRSISNEKGRRKRKKKKQTSATKCRICIDNACGTGPYKKKKNKTNKATKICVFCKKRICGTHCSKAVRIECDYCEPNIPDI